MIYINVTSIVLTVNGHSRKAFVLIMQFHYAIARIIVTGL